MANQKKFLDAEGVKYLWSKINMNDYPNNETLMGVIEAIDETKADKSELFSGSWNDLEDKPFYYGNEYIIVTEEATYASGDIVTTLNPQTYHHYQQPGTYIITYDSNTVFEWNKNGGYYNFGDDSYEEYPLQIKSSNPSQGATVYFKDEQPHLLKVEHVKQVAVPMDENFIPDTIARKKYVDSQIQTHTHTFDSLTDKPFYETVTYKTLYQSYGTSIPGNSTMSVTSSTLAEGEYYMRFNNVNYPFFITSDTTKIGPDENFPFVFQKMRSGQSSYTWILQSVDTSTSFTYALVSVNRDIKQLDKKFIPTEIVNRVNNSLTNDDIVIIEVDEIFPKSASSAIKAAVDNNKIIIAKVKTVSGRVYTTTQVSYEENSFSIVYPIGTSEERLMVWDDTVSYSSSFVSESVARKLKTWNEEKSGEAEFYPSINAMEEYVTSKIESMEVTPEDIIEWMTEESAIVPLASTSGQLYVTNNNKILII